MTDAVARKPLKIRTDEYDRMADLGVFGADRPRIELIGGQLYEKAPIGTAHLIAVTRLAQQLNWINAEGRLLVQQPIRLSEHDEPQPDIVILRERQHKVPLYIRAGILAVWIVNLREAVVEVTHGSTGRITNTAYYYPGETTDDDSTFADTGEIDLEALFEGLGELERDELLVGRGVACGWRAVGCRGRNTPSK